MRKEDAKGRFDRMIDTVLEDADIQLIHVSEQEQMDVIYLGNGLEELANRLGLEVEERHIHEEIFCKTINLKGFLVKQIERRGNKQCTDRK